MKLKYIGDGVAQVGTGDHAEAHGSFFHSFHRGERPVDIPDEFAEEVLSARDAWLARGFELID